MTKIFEHFWIKIIAIMLGLLLWLHVATEKSYNYQLNLPLTEIILDSNLTLAQAPPESLMIAVTATGKQLMRQKWQERGLKIIASQFKAGAHDIGLNKTNTFLISPVSDLILEEVLFPANITLNIDRITSANIRVKPDIITEPGNGFALSKLSDPDPKTVTVTGPFTVIRNLREINTERKELKGLRNNIELYLKIKPPDIYGIDIEPDSVKISLEIVPVKTRQFDNIPIVIYNIPNGQNVTTSPLTISVELTGPPAEINTLRKNAVIASVDFNLIDSLRMAPLKIDCPAKFNVKKTSTDSVTLISE